MSDSTPLVSVILCVRNGLPHLRDAVESVRAIAYPNYELVVQDGASTDGSLEYLRSLQGFPSITIVSQQDTGIGQAFNRAVQRCRGEIVGSIDADNFLKPDALDVVMRAFHACPDAAVVYGSCEMFDAAGTFLHSWTPPDFDLLGLMEGTVVPPFATSFFSRALCGADLRFDEQFITVADFELWSRLADRRIIRIPQVLGGVRIGQQSSTWNASNYEDQSGFKIRGLRRLVDGPARDRVLEQLYERCAAGIYLWAVDSMAVIGGGQTLINQYFEKATRTDLRSERFRDVLQRARPKLPASDPTLGVRLQECGIEYVERCHPEIALVYFEYLAAAGFASPDLAQWLVRAKQDRWNAQTQTEVASHLQAEVDRRDRIINDNESYWSAEVVKRDKVIDELRAEHEWMRSGWRRWIVRPPRRTPETT